MKTTFEPELSQVEFEALQLRIAETREEFLRRIANDRELSRLYGELRELQRIEVDARRARRECEIQEGAES